MPGPARAGALIYAKDLPRVSRCYESLLGMRVLLADAHHHVIESADFQLVIHAIPPAIAETFTIASPPAAREETAIKLFFTVPSLADAEAVLHAHGGRLLEGRWDGPGFAIANACDCEGNILQLRELRG